MSKFVKKEKISWNDMSGVFDQKKCDKDKVFISVGIDQNDEPFCFEFDLTGCTNINIIGFDFRHVCKYMSRMAQITAQNNESVKVLSVGSKDNEQFLSIMETIAREIENRFETLRNANVKTIADYNKCADKPMDYQLLFIHGFENTYANSTNSNRAKLEECVKTLLKFGRATGIHAVIDLGVSNTEFGRTVLPSMSDRINIIGSGDLVEVSAAYGNVRKILRIPTED